MSGWLDLCEGLVVALPTVAGWDDVAMIDGPPAGGDVPTLYCTVGYAYAEDSAGAYERDPVDAAALVSEAGWVRCELVARTGDEDAPAMRRLALQRLEALGTRLQDDPRLGNALPYVATARLMVDVLPVLNVSGTAVRCPFSVVYTART